MKRSILLLAAPLLALGLSACSGDGSYRVRSTWYDPYPYYGWYDGYYGSIHDGYWGSDGYFYFRLTDRDRHFRRGDRNHFRNDRVMPGGNYRQMQGNFTPRRDYKMPRYPRKKG